MNSGIYKIINKINGKYYVGKSKNIKGRWREHKSKLNRNIHPNEHLQNAWNKYGADAFEFVVVEYIDESLLKEIEQKYIDKFIEDRKNGVYDCYNIAITNDNNFTSEETRKKISERTKGKRVGENHPMYGRTHSIESRQKMSDSLKGKMAGENNPMYGKTGEKHPNYGKPLSDETKKKISNSLRDSNHTNVDKTIYTFKNILTNETYTGTRCNFRKTYNVSADSMWGLIHKIYLRTKSGWILLENN